MAKSKVRSAGDSGVSRFMKPGKGSSKSKISRDGEYTGVDRDANRLTKKGKK